MKKTNLEITHPHLINEWDWEKNFRPMEDYSAGSNYKAWWICLINPCGCHIYESSIVSRTKEKNPSGCPYCSGRKFCVHNNLLVKFPLLIDEWSPKNTKSILEYPRHVKVWWKCLINPCGCHEYEGTIERKIGKAPTGCPYCSNRKLCFHNNLKYKHPELIDEWPDDNNPMDSYSPGSDALVKWVCSKNLNHKWEARIYERTGKHKTGCPFCVNQKIIFENSLEKFYPELKIEWDPRNGLMRTYAPHSGKKVWWICSKSECNCHVWEATIIDRTSNNIGCPYCANLKLCLHNNLGVLFPALVLEWSSKNILSIFNYLPGSDEKAWWVCSQNLCGCHEWESVIRSRTSSRQHGCPFCSGHKCCKHYNLQTKFPELEVEWDPNNSKPMSEYSPHSNKEALWICSKNACGCHKWEAAINNRTAADPRGCPYCINIMLCSHNNLKFKHPELQEEWHTDNIKPMDQYPPGSDEKVKWVCKDNKTHIWITNVYARTGKGKSGCPHCSKSRGYSKMQIEWIKKIEIEENIIIQHALCPEGEYVINGVGKVDGYCEETNTVYEFHGSYFHGAPLIYDRDDINPTIKKTYGELYDRTISREMLIKDLGYNLVVKWENEK